MIQIKPVTHLPPHIQAVFDRLGETHMQHIQPGWFMAYAEIEDKSVFLVGQHPKLNESINAIECDPHIETIAPTTDLTPDLINQAAARAKDMIAGSVVVEEEIRKVLAVLGIPTDPPHHMEAYHRPEGVTFRWYGGNTRIPAQGFFLGPNLDTDIILGLSGFEILMQKRPPNALAFSARLVIDHARGSCTFSPYSPAFEGTIDNTGEPLISAVAQAFSFIHSDMARIAEEGLAMFRMVLGWGKLGVCANNSLENLRRAARQKKLNHRRRLKPSCQLLLISTWRIGSD